ncbi:complement C1q-like protein 2 isoform X2 [Littorina saxatilis]|uniref:C1q domain-containing protein n=1 Tax=Littorina saxatilis TaxID=31220 RepID=A0AAN9G9G3_9CAEN
MLCGPCVCLLLCLVLSNTVLMKSTVQGTVRAKPSYDVSTAPAQSLGELETCQASLMLMMQTELTSLRTKVSRLENSLHNVENATSRAVAFTAKISSDRDRNQQGVSLGHQQTVIFNEAITNVGDAYNTQTGIFTAPVAATFAFFLTLMGVNDSTDIYLDIVKNGVRLDMVFALGSSDLYDQGSTLLTTHLRVGDQVWVRQYRGNAVRGGPWTVFTGYLLHAD